jgi:hypothetical protein
MSAVSRISLEEAFSQALLYFRKPEAIARVVLSGRRRNMQTATERIDIRPVIIKDAILLPSLVERVREANTVSHIKKQE